jgi:branched-chain amino acid transport system permease protein
MGKGSSYSVAIMIVLGVYVILAVSLDLLVGFAGQISLGHAAFFAIGAYTSGVLTANYGLPALLALLIGLAFSGGLAWIIGWSVLALRGYYLAMATLGLSVIVYSLIVGLQSLTGGASGLRDIPPFSLFGFALDEYVYYYYFVWAVVCFVVGSSILLVNSSFGRTLTAIHSDETAASTLGIHCVKYKTSVFVITSMYAGLAGSLYAHYTSFLAPDDFSIFTSIHILIMVFLGGVGTIYGPALGAIFLKLLPELTHRFRDYELLGNGLILIAVLVFMQKGLWGMLIVLKKRMTSVFGKRKPQTFEGTAP